MDDLFALEKEEKTVMNSGFLEKTLNLFKTGLGFDTNIGSFLKWISNTYYPYQTIFVPEVPQNIKEYFSSHQVIFGKEAEFLGNKSIEDSVRQIAFGEKAYKQEVSHDVRDPRLQKVIKKMGVSSIFVIPLSAGDRIIGYLAFFENEVPRLWSKKETTELLSLSEIFTQFLYGETLNKELFSKEDILQKAIESSNDGYWHIDLKLNQMHFSRQWKRMLGFEEQELEDSFDSFENLLHPDDKEVVLQVLDPYLKIGVGSYECEYRIRNKQGKYLWVLTRANINFSENGIPLQFVATNTDITSRIEYKRKLTQSEAKYKRLLGSIHEIIFEIDSNGIVTFLNEAWERHLLFKINKTIGTLYTKYIHPEDRPKVYDVIRLEFTGQELVHITKEVRLLAANGQSVWMEIHFSVRFGESNKVEEVKGTLINIDERKRVELAKKASENRQARISENISDLIVEIDESGEYLFMSNASRTMLGRNPSEFLGNKAIHDVHEEEQETVSVNIFQQLLNGANRVVEQYRFKTADDEYIWVEAIVQPLISASGKRTFIAALRDISARRKIQEDMKLALKKEKDLNDLKSRFITMTSHEFRTPLSSIQSSVELLEMYADDLGDRFIKPFEKHFLKITNQVTRINSLLNNIDTLGKIESSSITYSPVQQDIIECVEKVISQKIAAEFTERKVNLAISGQQRIQLFDPMLLDSLVYNLCKNALLYSDSEVFVKVDATKEGILLEFKDSGLGIPEDEQAHLFSSFFRAKNIVNLNIPGNGLGLTISKKVVELHGGQIHLESVENEGTLVRVEIPLKEEI